MSDILQVLLSDRVGGAETIAHSLNDEWRARGIDSAIDYLDARVPGNVLQRRSSIRRMVRHHQPRVVLAHTATPSLYTRAFAPAGLPVFVMLHSASDDYAWRPRRTAEQLLRPRTAGVIAVSPGQYDQYAAHFGTRRLGLIYPGIRTTVASPTTMSGSAGVRIITLARIAAQKRPDLWVEVARRVTAIDRRTTFEWWGPAASQEPEMAKYLQLDLGPRVRFCGPTADPDTQLRHAHLMFHPSDREAPGLSLMEAAAAGLPIVCASNAASNLPDLIDPLTFETGDIDSAVGHVLHVVENYASVKHEAITRAPQILASYGTAAAAKAVLHFIQDARPGTLEGRHSD